MFDIDPVFGDKYLKIKTKKIQNIKITTNFKNGESNITKLPKEGIKCACYLTVVINPILKLDKSYYLETTDIAKRI